MTGTIQRVVYFARGPQSTDRCPHEHRSVDAARRCIERHDRAVMAATGGQRGSLRVIYRREANGSEFRVPM